MVGPNGAGKTTLLRCLAALDDPLSGRIVIDGLDTQVSPRRAHMKLGFLQDFFGVYDTLTVKQNLLHAAAAMRVPRAHIPEAARTAVLAVGLDDYIDRRAHELSRGLRQRLAIARTIIHNPKLLLLDEPASGLDPDARRELSDLIKSLQARGTTIIVSSHILTELQDYSTHMLSVRDGRVKPVVAIGGQTPEGHRLALTVVGAADKALEMLRTIPAVSDIRETGRQVFFNFSGSESEQAGLLRGLMAGDVQVTEFRVASENLEQLYFG